MQKPFFCCEGILYKTKSHNEYDCLVGLVVEVSASRAVDLSSIPAFILDLFPGQIIPVTETLILQWLPSQAPGVIGSALGLVGLV